MSAPQPSFPLSTSSPVLLGLPPAKSALLLFTPYLLCALAYVFFCAGDVFWWPGHPVFGLPRLFNLGAEGNLPAYLSALNLLVAGLLLLIITAAKPKGQRAAWAVLGAGFIFMSVDEAAQIHEPIIGRSFESHFGRFDSPFFHYGWVVVALVGVLVVGVCYLRFLWRLPRPYGRLFIASAALFVGGAVGMELVEGWMASGAAGPVSRNWFPWRMLAEEVGEAAGVALFVYSLLRYMKEHGARLLIEPVGDRVG